MSATLNYQLADQLKHFRDPGAGKEARLPVLMYLVLRANIRQRCWPNAETIAQDTGIGKPRVLNALQWLADQGAIYHVPPAKRVGSEKRPRASRHVYQLTGIIQLDAAPVEYLYLTPEARADMIEELARLGADEVVRLYDGSPSVAEDERDGTDSEPHVQHNGTDSEPIYGTENEPTAAT